MKFIKQRLLIWSEKNISRITENDQDVFYKYVDQYIENISAFENNWSYILQATRNQGFKIERYNSIVFFWLRSSTELVIVHRIGKGNTKIIGELSKICNKLNIKIIIKNVDINDIPQLESINFKVKDYPWSKYSFMDDNTYPQITCSVPGIIDLKKDSLRETHRYNIRKFIKKNSITVVPYDYSMDDIAKSFLRKNSEYLENKNVESKKEVYAAHTFFFNKKIKYAYRLAYMENKEIIAFGFYTVRNGLIYWNALLNKNQSNLMLFLLWLGVNYISESSNEPVTKLTLQGCETEGQYKWKQGFYPVEKIEKVHMIQL